MGPAITWVVSLAKWRAAGEVMRQELAGRPFWSVLALVAATTLLALRGRLLRVLVSLSPVIVTYERYRIVHTLAALAITFALALPVPMVLWTAGARCPRTRSQPLALALGEALLVMSSSSWQFPRLHGFSTDNGVAIRHFGWEEATLSAAARGVRRFAAVFVPLSFIAALNDPSRPLRQPREFARLAFSLAMVSLAAFSCAFSGREPDYAAPRTRARRSRYVQLHAFWFGPLVALPLAIAGLAAAGYFVAAGYFMGGSWNPCSLPSVPCMLWSDVVVGAGAAPPSRP